jgi:hypothetical protein
MTSRRVQGRRDAFLRPIECDAKARSSRLCGNECNSFSPSDSPLGVVYTHQPLYFVMLQDPHATLMYFVFFISHHASLWLLYTASNFHYTTTCNKYVVLYFHTIRLSYLISNYFSCRPKVLYAQNLPPSDFHIYKTRSVILDRCGLVFL